MTTRDHTRSGPVSAPPLDPEFTVCELASFRFLDGRVETQEPRGGTTVTFPIEFFPLVLRFAGWTTLTAALTASLRDDPIDPATTATFVRWMIDSGLLVERSATKLQKMDRWTPWGPALGYYLASRSRAGQPYISVADLDVQLEKKSHLEPQPPSFKDFLGNTFLELPTPPLEQVTGQPLPILLAHRRTHRAFRPGSLPLDQLASLLRMTWGATDEKPNQMGPDGFLRKTSPSGGSLHPVEVYVIALDVAGLSPAVYHYSVRRDGLELVSDADPRPWIVSACGGQEWVAGAAALFLSTAVVERSMWKYQFARAFRYLFLDAGHLSQTFCLAATHLKLAPFCIGALRDEIFERNLSLDFLEEPVLFVNGVGLQI